MELTMLFFIFVICLICVGAVGYGVMKLVDYAVASFRKTTQTSRTEMSAAYTSNGSNRSLLIAKFMESENLPETEYIFRYWNNETVANGLMARLNEDFVVNVTIDSCSFDKRVCNTIIKLISPSGKVYHIATSDQMQSFLNYNEMPRVKFVTNEIEQIETFEEDGKIRVLGQFELIYNKVYGDTNSDLLLIRKALEDYQIDDIVYEYPVEDSVRVFEMAYNVQGGYYFQPSEITVTRLGAHANSLYAPITVEYRGEAGQIFADAAIQQASLALRGNRNVYIWGAPGTGKTSLLDQVIARTYDDYDDVAIVRLTPTIFREVQNAAGLSQFKERVKSLNAAKVIFLMDEAESLLRLNPDNTHSEITSALLQLLDGDMRKQLNCNMVLIFNAERSTLDPAVFRENREGFKIELKPVDAQTAMKAVAYLKSQMPDCVFDEETFNKRLINPSLDSAGKQVAGKNEITLAAIVHCFSSKEETDHLIDAIRLARKAFNAEFHPAGTPPVKLKIPLLPGQKPKAERAPVQLPHLPGVTSTATTVKSKPHKFKYQGKKRK